jgi:tRNA threonylcarbamoyladenosine biosynthesis protein TsaB
MLLHDRHDPKSRPDKSMAAVLAFDTSTESLSVGLQANGQRWVANQPGGAAASAALLPAIHALLQQAGCGLGDLAAIGFGRGPGAFTGLRTSCAVAQGLAFGLGRPVLAIDSLLIVAEQARRQSAVADRLEVGVAMDARMGQAYAARYLWQGGAWQVLQAPGLWAPQALAQAWADPVPATLCGSGIELFDDLSAGAGQQPGRGLAGAGRTGLGCRADAGRR